MEKKKRDIPWHKFGKISTKNEMNTYINGYEYNHANFCHYTNCSSINSILKEKRIRISCVKWFNDSLDSQQFGDEKNYCFSLCFTSGKNENLSLWYLYSGLDGKGGRLRFNSDPLKRIIENGRYSLETVKKECDTENIPLEIGKDADKIFKDLIYYQINSEKPYITDLKYNTMTNHIFPTSEFERYKAENIGFLKNLIWYYEKETRLLIKLKNKEYKRIIDEIYDDPSKSNTSVYVYLDISDAIERNDILIDFAPEIENIEEIAKNNEDIRKYINATSKVGLSKYHGQIKMNLCQNCNKSNKQPNGK